MYKVGDIFYDDEEYELRARFCNENDYTIKEIEADENGRRFQITEKGELSQSALAEQEIEEIKFWFDNYYAQHEQKYRRLIALNMQTDEGLDPNQELMALYNEAEIKRRRIQAIEAVN